MKLYRNMSIEQIAEKEQIIYTVYIDRLIRLIRYVPDNIYYVSSIYHWDEEFTEPLVVGGEKVTFENLCKLIDYASTIHYISVVKDS